MAEELRRAGEPSYGLRRDEGFQGRSQQRRQGVFRDQEASVRDGEEFPEAVQGEVPEAADSVREEGVDAVLDYYRALLRGELGEGSLCSPVGETAEVDVQDDVPGGGGRGPPRAGAFVEPEVDVPFEKGGRQGGTAERGQPDRAGAAGGHGLQDLHQGGAPWRRRGSAPFPGSEGLGERGISGRARTVRDPGNPQGISWSGESTATMAPEDGAVASEGSQ